MGRKVEVEEIERREGKRDRYGRKAGRLKGEKERQRDREGKRKRLKGENWR